MLYLLGMALVATAVWKIAPELVLALDTRLGLPVDSYVNGSQTWLVGDDDTADAATVVLEFRLHPVAGYRIPAGCSHDDVWELVVAQLTATEQRADAAEPGMAQRGSNAHDADAAEPGMAQRGSDAHVADALRLGTETRPLTSLWDGLECFAAYGDDIEPAVLATDATRVLGRAPDASGLVDHDAIGDAWERSNGKVSIVALLLEQLAS